MGHTEQVNWPGWDVVGVLGQGSYGTVYKIQRDILGDVEEAALKVIRIPRDADEVNVLRVFEHKSDEEITHQFRSRAGDIAKEYKLIRKLNYHPNIVICTDFRDVQHADGFGWDVYIQMELLTPLTKSLDCVRTSKEIARLGMDLCKGLMACRENNIIHRDIKPGNIFVSKDGHFKLGDFGIARTISGDDATVATNVENYAYMAPEVSRREGCGMSADICSLGLVMHWLLNEGRAPFLPLLCASVTKKQWDEAVRRRLDGEPIPEPAHGSKALKAVVMKACAYDPEDRFQTAGEMYEALKAATEWAEKAHDELLSANRMERPEADEVDPSGAGKPDLVERIKSWMKTKQGQIAATAALAAVVLAALVFVISGLVGSSKGNRERPMVVSSAYTHAGNPGETAEDRPVPNIGDRVFFGSYEQDYNPNNGKERVEWIILDKTEDRVLLLSKQCLDCKAYNETREDVTWESSSLRAWLNNEFLQYVFDASEQEYVCETTLVNNGNSEYGVDGGKETKDKIFLLSLDEVDRYFASDNERKTNATEWAKASGVFVLEESGDSWWWLRTPGRDTLHAEYIYTYGYYDYIGDFVDRNVGGVRPAVWVDISDYSSGQMPLEKRVPVSPAEAEVGDSVLLGSYEQDNDWNNGKEDIEWIVLDKQDDRLLVISKFCLTCQPYHAEETAVTWETSSLRAWLNNTFVQDAFTEEERGQIVSSLIVNPGNEEGQIDGGNDTEDLVFLLSAEEAERYFGANSIRYSTPTEYARNLGINTNGDMSGSSWWWLRTLGRYTAHAAYVTSFGSLGADGARVTVNAGGVRPAMWISVS